MAQSTTLEQVQQLVDQLTSLEQLRLLEYLAPRLVRGVSHELGKMPSAAEAWRELFALGDRLAATDTPEQPTLTDAVLSMRR